MVGGAKVIVDSTTKVVLGCLIANYWGHGPWPHLPTPMGLPDI